MFLPKEIGHEPRILDRPQLTRRAVGLRAAGRRPEQAIWFEPPASRTATIRGAPDARAALCRLEGWRDAYRSAWAADPGGRDRIHAPAHRLPTAQWRHSRRRS